MTVVSYRLYCEHCDEETVLRESEVEESDWTVNALAFNEGICPNCSERSEQLSEQTKLPLEELDNIGQTAAQNLREAGYDTEEAIAEADDDEILDVSWVGEKVLFSVKREAGELEPQKRWDQKT